MSPRAAREPLPLLVPEPVPSRELKPGMRRLLGWCMILGALLLAMAFGAPVEAGVQRGVAIPNPLGIVGEALRDIFVRAFGIGAFLLAFLLVQRGSEFLSGRPLKRPIPRVVGAFVGMIGLSAMAMAFAPQKAFPGGEVPLGGALGLWIAELLAADLGHSLFAVSAILVSFAGIVLATEDLIPDLVRGVRPTSLATVEAEEEAAAQKPKRRVPRTKAEIEIPPAQKRGRSPRTKAEMPPEAAALAAALLDHVETAAPQKDPEVVEESPAKPKRKPKLKESARDLGPVPTRALLEDPAFQKGESGIGGIVPHIKPSKEPAKKPRAVVAAAAPVPQVQDDDTEAPIDDLALDAELLPRAAPPVRTYDAATEVESESDEADEELAAWEDEADTAADVDEESLTEEGEEWAEEAEGSAAEEWAENEVDEEALAAEASAEEDDSEEYEEEVADADDAPLSEELSTDEDNEASAASQDPLELVEPLPFSAGTAEAPPRKPPVRTEVTDNSEALALIRLDRSEGMRKRDRYPLPPLELLAEPKYLKQRESEESLQKKATTLEVALADFHVEAHVTEIERGPVITRFDLELSRGTRISKVTALQDDLALTLGVGAVRIAAVPGKSALGVEMPNEHRETVFLRDVAVATEGKLGKIAIPIFLGKDASGAPLVEDLSSTPHLLIAGRTGAGKSVFVNSLILSVLLTRRPEDVRLIMIDPKKVELEVYQEIPHLLTPVESNPKRATKILEWAVEQMEERYALLAAAGVRHLVGYNALKKPAREEKLLAVYPQDVVDQLPEQMPYIVIIVDELADLMMAAGKEVENAIARLAQKARAVGIHVVLATQRPSTDVITGLIKSNLPARIAFQTRTGIDSRTILDRMGAEKLLDKGDMLYLSSKSDEPRRIQGPFVSDDEVEQIVAYLREVASPYYQQRLEQVQSGDGDWSEAASQDEFFEQAVDIVMTTGQASASFLQRRLKVGYARASRLIDLMESAGIVSEHRGSKVREILVTPEQWTAMRGGAA